MLNGVPEKKILNCIKYNFQFVTYYRSQNNILLIKSVNNFFPRYFRQLMVIELKVKIPELW